MLSNSALARHAELLDRMANTVGVDLDEAAQRGILPTEDLSDLVFSCAGCSDISSCETWLDENQPAGSATTPSYCRNSAVLAGLRKPA